jgi:hypothetical protein
MVSIKEFYRRELGSLLKKIFPTKKEYLVLT